MKHFSGEAEEIDGAVPMYDNVFLQRKSFESYLYACGLDSVKILIIYCLRVERAIVIFTM